MTIQETKQDDKIILAVSGNVDTNTSPQLQTKILQGFQKSKSVTLDMSDCPYMSSAGLRALLIGEKTASSKSGSFELTNVQPAVMKVFNVTGFSKMLHIV